MWRVLLCIPFGAATYLAALVLVSGVVPRHSEGVRQCVSLPWMVFATLPWLLAAAISISGALFAARNARQRAAAVALLMLTIVVCNMLAVDLLRRDYIGKF
jgi:hypothetical protein